MPLSDNEIIRTIRQGAEEAFAELVDRYKDKAMTLAVRMLKSREDAEEAVQDSFVRAHNALNKFKGTSKFSTWFYRILYNVCLTRLGKRKEELKIGSGEEREFEIEDRQNVDPYTALASKDLIHAIKKIIEEIPERYSSILSLFYFQELSYEEICEVTRLPLGTVKAHLFRARAILQKRLPREIQSEYRSSARN